MPHLCTSQAVLEFDGTWICCSTQQTQREREIKLCSFAEHFKQPDELSPQNKNTKAEGSQVKPRMYSVKARKERIYILVKPRLPDCWDWKDRRSHSFPAAPLLWASLHFCERGHSEKEQEKVNWIWPSWAVHSACKTFFLRTDSIRHPCISHSMHVPYVGGKLISRILNSFVLRKIYLKYYPPSTVCLSIRLN